MPQSFCAQSEGQHGPISLCNTLNLKRSRRTKCAISEGLNRVCPAQVRKVYVVIEGTNSRWLIEAHGHLHNNIAGALVVAYWLHVDALGGVDIRANEEQVSLAEVQMVSRGKKVRLELECCVSLDVGLTFVDFLA